MSSLETCGIPGCINGFNGLELGESRRGLRRVISSEWPGLDRPAPPSAVNERTLLTENLGASPGSNPDV